MKKITTKPISHSKLSQLIDFDTTYLLSLMKEIEIPEQQLPLPLSLDSLEKSLDTHDILEWIFLDHHLAGYFWLEYKIDYLYIAGLVIKTDFHGQDLCQYALKCAEEKALEHGFNTCKLAVIPLNGRALNAYLKYGYKITECIPSFFGHEHPESVRFIMTKNLLPSDTTPNDDAGYALGCIEYEKIKEATQKGDLGVRLLPSETKDSYQNRIWFERKGR
jgi:ribosomal protein S18 acetylase RimI-like enzyme